MGRVKLPEEIGEKYYNREGVTATEVIDGKRISGIIAIEHPDFDVSLLRGEHYYGKIDYYIEFEDE